MSQNDNEGGGRPRAFSVPTFFPFMMPCSKFSGARGTNEITFKQWKTDLEMWFRMYGIPAANQLDWVLNSIEGEAKREVAILPQDQKDTVQKVFEKLEGLYSCTVPASASRSLFFNCRQQAEESVRTFALRLQECWQKMMIHDAQNILNPDVLMRDQFITGLVNENLKRDLRMKVTLDNTLKFADVKREATLRSGPEENDQAWCGMVKAAPSKRPWEDDLQRLKVELKAELAREVETQVTNLSQSLLQGVRDEIRKVTFEKVPLNQSPSTHLVPQRSRSFSPGPRHQRTGPQARARECDDQGRPICYNCRTPGHIARQCPQINPQAQLN